MNIFIFDDRIGDMEQVKNIDVSNFDAEVLASDVPVLVDFWAPWCGPCRMMAPILDMLAEGSEGKFKVMKVDVENPVNAPLAIKYQIASIPNMKLFKGGAVADEFIGVTDLKTLQAAIKEDLDD